MKPQTHKKTTATNFLNQQFHFFISAFTLSVFFLISVQSSAQDDYRIPYRSGALWGYADQSGSVVVQPIYDRVSASHEDQRWQVVKNGKTGVVDQNGTEILSPDYDKIYEDLKNNEYHDYFVVKDGKTGYADMNGKLLLEPIYEEVVVCSYPWMPTGQGAYNFFVRYGNVWNLIDSTGTVFIEHINDYKPLGDGAYILEVGNKWGIYGVTNKHWYFEPVYDIIARMDLFDYAVLKEEYSNYVFYARKGNELFLITNQGELINAGEQELESFFETPEEHYGDAMADAGDMESPALYGRRIKQVRQMELTEKEGVLTVTFKRKYESGITTVNVLQKKEYVGVNVQYNESSVELPAVYEEIALVEQGGYIDSDYLLVKKKSKWGIYGLAENTMLVPAVMDSIVLNPYPGIFELWKDNRLGIFVESRNSTWTKAAALYITPSFDQFFDVVSVTSIGKNYSTFTVYYFKNDNEICPVGQNGVHFYKVD